MGVSNQRDIRSKMLLFFIAISSLSLLFCNSKQVIRADPNVKITVYYESLCSDSVRFVTEQLNKNWMKFGDELTISYKPFGKANFTENDQSWDFTCQHGPNECWGNKVQACALNSVSNAEEIVPLINCLMLSTISLGPEAALVNCVLGLNVINPPRITPTPEELLECSKGDEGSSLLHDLGVETHALQPPLTFVPWILFNDEFVEMDWQLALTDLEKVLCDKYLAGSSKC